MWAARLSMAKQVRRIQGSDCALPAPDYIMVALSGAIRSVPEYPLPQSGGASGPRVRIRLSSHRR